MPYRDIPFCDFCDAQLPRIVPYTGLLEIKISGEPMVRFINHRFLICETCGKGRTIFDLHNKVREQNSFGTE